MSVSLNDLPQYEDFKDSFVAFIDVLGFDARVKAIEGSRQFLDIAKLLYAVKNTARVYSSDSGIFDRFQITAISDSLIITVPFADPIAAVGLVRILQNFQYELLATNFRTLVRGYINRGNVYHKDGLLFGAGYSEAYAKEGKIGGAPRIVVSPEIIDDARRAVDSYSGEKEVATVFDYIRKDREDGNYFIDYLNPNEAQFSYFSEEQSEFQQEERVEERKSIVRFIDHCLVEYKANENIRAKYEWLKVYFERPNLS